METKFGNEVIVSPCLNCIQSGVDERMVKDGIDLLNKLESILEDFNKRYEKE